VNAIGTSVCGQDVGSVYAAVGSSALAELGLWMVNTSSELAAVMRRLISAFEKRDAATAKSLISQRDETLIIGSDAKEWLYGVEGYEVFAAQVLKTPEFRWTIHRLDAFTKGTVGWAAADSTADFDNGRSTEFRVTAVFVLEEGVWRVAQWHASVPVASIEISGAELPMSLADLLVVVDDDVQVELEARFKTSTVTLLFSDIEDSTNRSTELGDAVWGDVVRRHFAELQRVANAQGGFVVKTMGDGAMLAFESARDAARSAVAIQRSVARQKAAKPFRVRVGVHTGDAMHADGDYFGQMVDKTARIAASAEGGQVLVSDVVRGLVDDTPGLDFGDPIALTLKGIPGTQTAYPLVDASGSVAAPITQSER
jgi:class 3 adenylate cyclase